MSPNLLSTWKRLSDEPTSQRDLAWVRVRHLIERAIGDGDLNPGSALPSERDLAELLGLSRVTVRRAISALVHDGVLIQRHGAGTFVAGRIVKSFSRLTSFSDDLRARGMRPRSVFLERSVGEANPEETMALSLSPGARVCRIYRLRYAGDQPLAIERTAVPQSMLPDPQLVAASLYETLDKYGCRPQRALQRLRAVNFDAEQAAQLRVAVGAAGLLIERRSFLDDGRVVEFTCSWYRGDAYDFVAELTGDDAIARDR
ncbi:GntR family transcriptional regulator [Tahibacter amnicola]|uniref:GntR family transcriptional regulator n=1 Tax=Tahibacter amnicola TaxID=2976241 RepID=A0ABY6BGK6_9GAMM|nr:GntR family transcriptional regulator [Tahibacter amnicola]UXI68970.1 GntR family transcriptional regulator [Tahibacter amnicola]